MPLRDPTHPRLGRSIPGARITEEVKVASENVIAYVHRMRAEGWRLDSKGKPLWDPTFKDNRVPMTFSKAA